MRLVQRIVMFVGGSPALSRGSQTALPDFVATRTWLPVRLLLGIRIVFDELADSSGQNSTTMHCNA